MLPHALTPSPWLHRFACLSAAATLLLLIAGGLVTSHGVGLAVPDWPNTYGYNLFFFPVSKWMGGIFYEHTHRLVGAAVGLLTSILALWLYGRKARKFLRWVGQGLIIAAVATLSAAPARRADAFVLGLTGCLAWAASFFWPMAEPAPRWLKRLGLAAFFLVVLQGVLGGLRVVLFKDQIGIFHATVAQLFFVLTCSLALFTSPWWQRESARKPHPGRAGLAPWFLGATLLILAQLVLGATMRHQHAGLAIPDFPLAYGKLWPATDPAAVARYEQQRLEVTAVNPITAFQIELQMAHRLVALAILAAVAGCAWLAHRRLGARDPLARLTAAWLMVILIQVLLGAATNWSNKAADIATAHVMVGGLSLAMGAILSIVVGRSFMLSRRHAQQTQAREAAPSISFGGKIASAGNP